MTQTETKIFHYDLRGHLIAETNQTGQMLAEYVYLGDQLLAMIKPGESVYYFHNDHLGTPQVLTNDSQAIAWKAVYTPFGEAVTSIQTVENPFRSPGQYYDPETGLHYNYFRYYNPQTGRYITPDPIGLEGGMNLFAYTNNPVNFIDPLGLFESYWFMKWVPGQHFFDLGMTNIEKGQYGWAAAHFAGMFAEQVVFVLSLGQGMPAGSAATACEVGVAKTGAREAAAVADDVAAWLGRGTRVIRNDAGDTIFLSKDGLRRLRFDFNRPYPHQSPHGHVEEFSRGRWTKSGPIYPRDVPH